MALQSRDYLNKLGFGVTDYLRVDGNNIINSLGVEIKGLTSQENNVLAFLISRVNTVCSYEQLADVLWGDEALERFSMYSINKVVFQIRRKLRINGQHNVAIKTRRNIGYILSY
ncbi:helix-turn-helix domain-containing protein [candidate division WWE3 bacterium]|uniref:Helix-turn-helix domain-containing protein n=1 Tax=candidate division WWE3 bacterium TaxID=2053526 RepID=A0A955J1W3_UNCKA|nr:helix-turn-helix domain-containing protein [candidate division WWE3 bacterium]